MERKNLDVAFKIEYTKSRVITDAEAKELNLDTGMEIFEFKGHGSTFGNIDHGGDRVIKGAFLDFIAELKDRGENLSALWQHKHAEPIGIFIELREDDKGLFVHGILPKDDDFVKGRVIPQMRIGSVRKMSIGYSVLDFDFDGEVRDLKKLHLWEISLVTVPMNNQASVTEMKAVVPFQDLPLSSRDRRWDEFAAVRRIMEWSNGMDDAMLADPDTQAKFKQAFLYYDQSKPEQLRSYKLPIADVIDGELKAVPRAIFAAAAALRGVRGGLNIPPESIPSIIRHLSRYYAKMGLESPFKEEASFRLDDLSCVDERTLEKLFKSGVRFDSKVSKALVSALKAAGLRDEEGGNRDGKLSELLGEIKTLTETLKR